MGLMQSIRRMMGANVEQEKAPPHDERRRHRRIQSVKLTIVIGENRYKTKDWSLGGFRIHALDQKFQANGHVAGLIHGPGLFDRGTFDGFIAWVSESGEVGVRFSEVSRESFMAMSAAQR